MKKIIFVAIGLQISVSTFAQTHISGTDTDNSGEFLASNVFYHL